MAAQPKAFFLEDLKIPLSPWLDPGSVEKDRDPKQEKEKETNGKGAAPPRISPKAPLKAAQGQGAVRYQKSDTRTVTRTAVEEYAGARRRSSCERGVSMFRTA